MPTYEVQSPIRRGGVRHEVGSVIEIDVDGDAERLVERGRITPAAADDADPARMTVDQIRSALDRLGVSHKGLSRKADLAKALSAASGEAVPEGDQ